MALESEHKEALAGLLAEHLDPGNTREGILSAREVDAIREVIKPRTERRKLGQRRRGYRL